MSSIEKVLIESSFLAKVTFSAKVEKVFNGTEVGDLFCKLDAQEQAKFFSQINQKWMPMQLEYMQEHLSDESRYVMGLIGEYASKDKDFNGGAE